MFTEQQIKAAHSKVKSGADFPQYVQEIKQLGLTHYEFWVTDGYTAYYGKNNYSVNGTPRYKSQVIDTHSSATDLRDIIAIHQQGKTDFMTFCRQTAAAGVEKWVVDTQKMLCVYYEIAGNEMLAEPIPQVNY